VQFLVDNRALYDCLELCNIPERSISCASLPHYLQRYGFKITIEPEDVCPVVTLPDNWTTYLEMLDKKQRHELRRKLRRAQGVNTDVSWYMVGPEHNLEEEMAHFLEMMAASSPDKARFLSDPQNLTFFKNITTVLRDRGWLQLNFLLINGKRAAAYLNFDYNKHILVYNSGLRTEYSSFSAGIVLLAFTIQRAIETGHEVFDFLQGNEVYKYHLGGKDTAVLNLTARFAE
jgi:CelD/BcsL family acetyltransferase involved in cellulose biosynthesis